MSEDHVPSYLQRLSTDEYEAPEYTDEDEAAIRGLHDIAGDAPRAVGAAPVEYWSSKLGTAAGLLSINVVTPKGEHFYNVPAEAAFDVAAAQEAFVAGRSVIDVQTHFLIDSDNSQLAIPHMTSHVSKIMPSWWRGLEEIGDRGLQDYLRCVFLESSNTVVVLSSAPTESMMASNGEMAAARELFDRCGAQARMLTHTVVIPTYADDLEAMDKWAAAGTVAWKVYTDPEVGGLIGMDPRLLPISPPLHAWTLDSDVGTAFLERVRETGVKMVCAHKGLGTHPAASPADVGPAAKAFPDIDFLIYHSGYEAQTRENVPPEGPYDPNNGRGIDRLITSVLGAGLGHGSNVYAELGTTWFNLIRKPDQAAHALGKLLVAFGPDNIMWGTDSVWYGPAEPLIDTFRAFQIPVSYQQEFGYPALTDEIKAKILGYNAARVYGIDLDAAQAIADQDDLTWVQRAADEFRAKGLPPLRP